MATDVLELKQSGVTYSTSRPSTWRGYEAGPEGLEIIMIGAASLGDARREDVEGQRDRRADGQSGRLARLRLPVKARGQRRSHRVPAR